MIIVRGAALQQQQQQREEEEEDRLSFPGFSVAAPNPRIHRTFGRHADLVKSGAADLTPRAIGGSDLSLSNLHVNPIKCLKARS